jgi:SOS-response transcriptional repressor LexA
METTRDDVHAAFEFLRGLVANPKNLVAVRMHDGEDIVVIERGAGSEGELVVVRLTLGSERRTALGRLTRDRGCMSWQPANPRWAARDFRPGAVQVLGRVLSVIHPLGQNGQPEAA